MRRRQSYASKATHLSVQYRQKSLVVDPCFVNVNLSRPRSCSKTCNPQNPRCTRSHPGTRMMHAHLHTHTDDGHPSLPPPVHARPPARRQACRHACTHTPFHLGSRYSIFAQTLLVFGRNQRRFSCESLQCPKGLNWFIAFEESLGISANLSTSPSHNHHHFLPPFFFGAKCDYPRTLTQLSQNSRNKP